MIVRQEQPADHRATEEVVRDAFWNLYAAGAVEHFIVHRVRSDPSFIPELDLVAEDDGRIVGHVMCERGQVVADDGTRHEVLTLGPLCAARTHQRNGIGTTLIETALRIATDLGFRAVMVLGDGDYYSRHGFAPAERYGIHLDGWYLDALQARELVPGALNGVSGRYVDALLPLVDAEALAAFDAAFPSRSLPTRADRTRYADDLAKHEAARRPARPDEGTGTGTGTGEHQPAAVPDDGH